MTIYTDGLVTRPDRNLLDDVASGTWEAAGAAFQQAWFENPTTALRRMGELNEAEQGRITQNAYPAYNIPEQREAPATPLLSAEDARKRVAESGVKLNIEDAGIREGALDILIRRKQEEHQRQMVMDSAPGSSVPLQLLAGFAASAIDPINVASAFIPVVGEARYASLLARAGTSTASRFAARAQVGAIEGAVGSALVEPIVLAASAQDQADYGIKDSLLNIAFGSMLGGGLHGAGGYLSDVRRGTLLDEVKAEGRPEVATPASDVAPVQTEAPRMTLAQAIARGDDNPMVALRTALERGIQLDRENIRTAAQAQARDELMPDIRAQIEEVANGRIPNVADIRAEQAQIQQQMDALDGTFKQRAKEFQGQRQSRKKAEQSARQAIAQERETLQARYDEISQSLDVNRQSEIGRRERNALNRGEIPERFQESINQRAEQIARGFDLTGTARAVAENAPWQVRQSALRAAVAQAVTGRDIDVQALFDLPDPLKRDAALAQLKKPSALRVDREGEQSSARMEELSKAPDGTELADAEKLLNDELALTQEAARQAGLDLDQFMAEANTQAADSLSYAAAYRAAAVCQLRT